MIKTGQAICEVILSYFQRWWWSKKYYFKHFKIVLSRIWKVMEIQKVWEPLIKAEKHTVSFHSVVCRDHMERVDFTEKYKHCDQTNTSQLMAWVLGWTIFLSSQLKIGQYSENLSENIMFGDSEDRRVGHDLHIIWSIVHVGRILFCLFQQDSRWFAAKC